MLPHLRSYVLPASLALTSLCSLAQAQEYKAGSLTIVHPWVRSVPGSQVGAGYLTITNTGSSADRLIGGTLTGARRADVHETANKGGINRMRPVEGGLEIKPGETVKLAPGGYHLMFTDLKGSFASSGEPIQGTLQFEKAGTVSVEFEAQPLGAKPSLDHTRNH